jgi:hypothetical protein
MESALSGGRHKERQEGMYGSVLNGGRKNEMRKRKEYEGGGGKRKGGRDG